MIIYNNISANNASILVCAHSGLINCKVGFRSRALRKILLIILTIDCGHVLVSSVRDNEFSAVIEK